MTKTTFIVVVILKVNWVKKNLSPPLAEFPSTTKPFPSLLPPESRNRSIRETMQEERTDESTLTEGVLASKFNRVHRQYVILYTVQYILYSIYLL